MTQLTVLLPVFNGPFSFGHFALERKDLREIPSLFPFFSILARGSKWIPSPRPASDEMLTFDLEDYIKRLKWAVHFHQQDQFRRPSLPLGVIRKKISPFLFSRMNCTECRKPARFYSDPSTAEVPSLIPVNVSNYISQIRSAFPGCLFRSQVRPIFPNLSKESHQLYKTLRNHSQWKVLLADKNMGMVLIPRDVYNSQLELHLSDTDSYEQISMLDVTTRFLSLSRSVERFSRDFQLPQSFYIGSILKGPFDFRFLSSYLPNIYLLVKVHKPEVSWRPIIACHSHVLKGLDVLLSKCLRKLLLHIPFIVLSSNSVARYLYGLCVPVSEQKPKMVQMDIKSMYPSIKPAACLAAISGFLQQIQHEDKEFIVRGLELLFRSFTFQARSPTTQESRYFLQKQGLPMGISVAPEVANLYFYIAIENALRLPHLDVMLCYFRFLDDIFFLHTGSVEDIQVLVHAMENQTDEFRFTFDISDTSQSFLDLEFYWDSTDSHHVLDFKPYYKPFSKFSYIFEGSCHPRANTRSWIATELLRLRRLSSHEENYVAAVSFFYRNLSNRGYQPEYLEPLFASVPYDFPGPLMSLDPIMRFTHDFTNFQQQPPQPI